MAKNKYRVTYYINGRQFPVHTEVTAPSSYEAYKHICSLYDVHHFETIIKIIKQTEPCEKELQKNF